MDLGKVTDAGRLVYNLFNVTCCGSGSSVPQASFSSLMSQMISLLDNVVGETSPRGSHTLARVDRTPHSVCFAVSSSCLAYESSSSPLLASLLSSNSPSLLYHLWRWNVPSLKISFAIHFFICASSTVAPPDIKSSMYRLLHILSMNLGY